MNSVAKQTLLVVAGLLLLGAGWFLVRRPVGDPSLANAALPHDPAELDRIRPQVEAFCGDCHATPRPESFPREAWFDEVNRGYEFYYQSGRTDLQLPLKQDLYTFYRSQAPEALAITPPAAPDDSRLKFRRENVTTPRQGRKANPALAHLKWIAAKGSSAAHSGSLLVCDMRRNEFRELRFSGSEFSWGVGLSLGHVSHAEATDLDADGHTDFVIADLGSFLPEDHDRGRVLWVPTSETGELLEPVELVSGLGRVADVRPADFDRDGDLDLVVAEFGLHTTGRILLLENSGSHRDFQLRVLDERPGAIHTPPVDLNNDGWLDFVALISQEHEVVEAFMNDGQGGFVRERIFQAGDPSYGSSGIELVDLDRDGDVDLLYTNGDMYDSYYIKPYHAIHWIENLGGDGWQDHVLARMPGVFRAMPADLDRDGDLDIAAVAFIPERLLEQNSDIPLDSVVWLEQVSEGKFVCRSLETGGTHHAALEAADFDGDGDTDLAIGNFREGSEVLLTVWWNETPAFEPGDAP